MAFINFGMANTLAQAKASTNKNKLFFPTDTHSIVIDGKEYGDSYAVVDIGTQSNFTGTYPNGYYDLSISGNDDLYTLLLNIWNSKRIPVLRVALNSHTVGVTLPLLKTNNDEFQGSGKVSNDWVLYARIYNGNGIKRIYTVGVYTKPASGIPKTDLASPVQAALETFLPIPMEIDPSGSIEIGSMVDVVAGITAYFNGATKYPYILFSDAAVPVQITIDVANGIAVFDGQFVCSPALALGTGCEEGEKYNIKVVVDVNDIDTKDDITITKAIGAINEFEYIVDSALPTASASTMNKIYLIPSTNPNTPTAKDLYITIATVNGQSVSYSWECIGSTTIDLSGYTTQAQLNAALAPIVNMRLSSNGIRDISNASDSVTASEKAVRAAIDALDTPFGVLAEAITYLYNENRALRTMLGGGDNAVLPTVKAIEVEYEQLSSFGTPAILTSKTAGAPTASNIPDNWDEKTMTVWNGCPRFMGQKYIDQSSKKVYIAVTLTGSTSDWVALN